MEMVNAFDEEFPGAFKTIKKIFADHQTEWHKEYCYCPVGLGLEYIKAYGDPEKLKADEFYAASYGSRLAVLSSWKHAKSVYRISEGLTSEFLKSKDEDIKVTSDLLSIPEYCIYIDTMRGFADIDGLFVMFDDDKARGKKELYISPVRGNDTLTSIYLVIPNKPTLLSMIMGQEWIDMHEELKARNNVSVDMEENYFKASQQTIRYVINVLMYLSAVNAEVRFTNSRSLRTCGKAKETAKGVKRFEVGEHIGVRLKKFQKHITRYEYENNDVEKLGDTHRSPAMHIRRAHYHTFLTGKGRQERKVKWLPPIVVNAVGEEIDYVSITNVNDEE